MGKKVRFAYRENPELLYKLKIIAERKEIKVNKILDKFCSDIIKEYEDFYGEINFMEDIFLEDYF